LNFDETFAPVARFESIHILLAYTTHHDFKFYQMDVKRAFLNRPIKEDVYVEHGMNDLGIFSLAMVSGLVKRILHSLLEGWARI
jgi:hypothetical protein